MKPIEEPKLNMTTASTTDSHARPEPFTFYPPKNNRLVTWLVQRGIRSSIRRKLHVTKIEISDEDLEQLRQLKGKRCLVTPSHSGGFEPHLIMYLSKLLGDSYNDVAAMELFRRSLINRFLMPRMGVYSIIRGAVDRPSFNMTRKLLASGNRWLVIMPQTNGQRSKRSPLNWNLPFVACWRRWKQVVAWCSNPSASK